MRCCQYFPNPVKLPFVLNVSCSEILDRGFRLPVSHVIHTVGPIYHTDDHPEVSLQSAYRYLIRIQAFVLCVTTRGFMIALSQNHLFTILLQKLLKAC